jgi:hypothetical protein
MGISIEIFAMRQQSFAKSVHKINDTNHNYESDMWKPDPSKEHPLMTSIRDTITKYRLQSAAHFDVSVNVKQPFHIENVEMVRSTRLNVVFGNWEHQESYVCRPVLRKHPRKKIHVLTKKVEVSDNATGGFISLMKFLNMVFPCYPDEVGIHQMRKWWTANGRAFNWASLPTELKEQVIQCCLHQPLEGSDYKQMLSRWRDRCRPRDGRREFGIYEIIDKITDWAALLRVSHQVRAITLRLCFAGSSGMASRGGFTIVASTCHSLDSTLLRLAHHYQMTDVNSLPVDYATQALAICYRQYPRIYPQLKNYATFRHGLRNIYLCMDFIAYMHFFKVTIDSFKYHLRPGSISYEVFEQLPDLSHIAIRLPLQPHQGWLDQPGQPAPRLFYTDFPCPRALHRVIYERIAEVLTLHPGVKVNGFVDMDEKARYKDLRTAAMLERKWTPAVLEELYAECGGGINLEVPVQPGSWLLDDTEEQPVTSNATEHHSEEPEEPFFPPKCRCVVQCFLIFHEKEKKRRYYHTPGGS